MCDVSSLVSLRGSLALPEMFNQQDYVQLKENYLRKGKLFVDSSFPPDSSSLGYLELPCYLQGRVEWIRASELLKAQGVSLEPPFFMESSSKLDYSQGQVGNCWFLAAVASLKFQKDLLVQVVPVEQNFQEYAGIFHFRFWRFGKWVDVVVDDYLPTFQKQLLSVYSKTNLEFWVPLLEKAYAKLYGSYKLMNDAFPAEAFKDFLGGFQMTYKLQEVVDKKQEELLWASITRALSYKSILCCSTAMRGDVLVNTVSDTGLLSCHTYIVTKVTEIFDGPTQQRHLLVKLMNPWGEKEWTGKWSDKSRVWDSISVEERGKLIKKDDGEFWMELKDFLTYFQMLTVCCENPVFMSTEVTEVTEVIEVTTQWKTLSFDGKWIAGTSAGGSLDKPSFWMNPQYRLTVGGVEGLEVKVLLSLMQKPSTLGDARLRATGFTIFQVPAGTPAGRLDASFFLSKAPLKKFFSWDRDLTEVVLLKAGEYLVVPSFLEPNESGRFFFTVTSSVDTTVVEYVEVEEIVMSSTTVTLPTEKEVVFDMFKKYVVEDGEVVVDAKQMMLLLNEHVAADLKVKFDWSDCKSMLAMVDTERTGKLTFMQFMVLWSKFAVFMKIFYQFNFSKSGTLTFEELKKALEFAGIELNENILKMQYTMLKERSTITLVDFLMFMLRMDSMASGVFASVTLPTEKEVVLDIFQKYGADQEGEVELNETQMMMLLNEHLVAGLTEKFDWSICKSMLAMVDTERVGKLTFKQFFVLWTKFATFRKIFYQLNISKSGILSFEELQNALKIAGIELDENVLKMKSAILQERSYVSLVDFLMFMLRIDTMSSGVVASVSLPTQKEVVFDMFKKYTAEDVVDAKQMMLLLNEHVAADLTEKFDWSVCKSMLSVVDTEQVGKVTFTQFTVLWTKIAEYMEIFYQLNVSKSGTLTFEDLQKALKIADIVYNENVLKMQYILLCSRSYVSLVDFFMFMLRMDSMSRGVYSLVTLPTEEEVVYDMFKKYADQNGDLTLDAKQLMLLLNEHVGLTEKFDWTVCKSMMAMVDTERVGKLTFTQFTLLWGRFAEFMKIFYQLILTKSETLTFDDLHNALKVTDVILNENVLRTQYMLLQERSTITLVGFLVFMLRLDSMSRGAFALVTLPTEKEVVMDIYKKYADLEDGEMMLSSKRMMLLLNEQVAVGLTEKFDWSICKSMLAMVDTERVGKLTFTQFSVLWNKFTVFMKIYFQSNVFKSGTLTFEEVQNALKVAGIVVNENVLKMQYSMLQSDSYVSLVDFLMFMLRLDNMASAVVALVSLPTDKEVVYAMFKKYADLESGDVWTISGKRMMMLLNEQVVAGLTEKFDWSACKSMLAMVDTERVGKLTFTQFSVLWSKFTVFMKIYFQSNVFKLGTLTFEEVQNALKVAGIVVNENVLKMQYSMLQSDSYVSLVDFLMFMLRLDNMASAVVPLVSLPTDKEVVYAMFKKYADLKIYFQSNVFKSGTLTFEEVQNALKVAGIVVNENVLKMQYSMLQSDSYVSLVDFLMFMLRLDNMASAVVPLVSLPTDKEVVYAMFKKYADLESGDVWTISGKRMMMLLNEQVVAGLTETFDWSSCKSMLAMVDVERTGKLTFTQFMTLWSKFSVYMKFYYESNISKTGTINYDEVQKALQVAGIVLDENMVKMQYTMLLAYPYISLVDFIMFMLRLDSMAVTFTVTEVVSTDMNGMVTSKSMSWSEWTTVTSEQI